LIEETAVIYIADYLVFVCKMKFSVTTMHT
jgi:hypothetical protein